MSLSSKGGGSQKFWPKIKKLESRWSQNLQSGKDILVELENMRVELAKLSESGIYSSSILLN